MHPFYNAKNSKPSEKKKEGIQEGTQLLHTELGYKNNLLTQVEPPPFC